jgi:hypothetical protein
MERREYWVCLMSHRMNENRIRKQSVRRFFMQKLNLSVFLIAILVVTPAFADSVDLTTGGHLYGETPVYVGQGLSESFSLNAASTVSVMFDLQRGPFGGGCCEVTEVEVDGNVMSGAVSLAAGTHTAEILGLECDGECVGGIAGYVDFYNIPGSSFGTGGMILPESNAGFYGLEIVGTTDPTPEPGTLILLFTGLLGLGAGVRRKFLKAA